MSYAILGDSASSTERQGSSTGVPWPVSQRCWRCIVWGLNGARPDRGGRGSPGCLLNVGDPPTRCGLGGLDLMCVRRCPTLPHPPGCSTIGAVGLSFRVRNGTGRFPHAMTAVTLLPVPLCAPVRVFPGWEVCVWLQLCGVVIQLLVPGTVVVREPHSGRVQCCVWCKLLAY